MKTLTDVAEEEIIVLESLFCIGGEFNRLSNNIIRIRFHDNCFITFELEEDYPSSKPYLSVSLELLTRSQNEMFKNKTNEFTEDLVGVEQQMLAIIDFAKDLYDNFKNEDRKEAVVQDVEEELLIVKIDHMRSSGPYIRTLEAWSSQLGLVTILITSGDQGIVLLSQGDKCQITKLLLNWKTTNIDVDSRGKPCKERMIQILHRERTGDEEELKSICGESFSTASCKTLSEHFKNSKLERQISKTFY